MLTWANGAVQTDWFGFFCVVGPISFVDTPVVQSVKENETAVISCQVDGDPKPIISWLYNGYTIDGDNFSTKWIFEFSLIFLPFVAVADDASKYMRSADGLIVKRVMKNDSGEYTCRAYQISATINNVKEQTIRLNVQRKFDSRYSIAPTLHSFLLTFRR